MLKPDDPAWVELVADINALVCSRYVEDTERPSSMFPVYMKSKDESGVEFSSLHRGDRRELLTDADFWLRYEDYGGLFLMENCSATSARAYVGQSSRNASGVFRSKPELASHGLGQEEETTTDI